MQTRLITLLAVLALTLSLPVRAQAQGAITTTTITEAITTTRPTTITANSATGISAGIWLLIDNELMRVAQSYVSGTAVPVLRNNQRPATHADNARVWVVPAGAILTRAPVGSCTRGGADAIFTHSFTNDGRIAVCRLGIDVAGATHKMGR